MTLVIKTTGAQDYLEGEGYIKCLMLGAPSAGKTRSAGFWPSPIFADCEKGRMSIADLSLPYAEVLTQADMEQLLRLLQAECRKPVNERKYKTLVLDTLDAYQRIVIQERLTAEKKEAMSGFGDWGYLDAKMQQLVSRLLSLPMNIVVNCHVKDVSTGDDESGKSLLMGPKLKGDLRDQIAAEFDLVGYMGTYWEAEDGERTLRRGIQWQPDPSKPILKDRSGRLPKWTPVSFSQDDFATIFDALIGGLDLAESKVLLELPSDAPEPVKPTPGGPVANAPEPRQTKPTKVKETTSSTSKTAKVPAAAKPTISAPTVESAEEEAATVPSESGADAAPLITDADGVVVDTGTPETTHDEAVNTAVEQLGGEVVSDDVTAEAEPQESASQDTPTPVDSEAREVICGTDPNTGLEGKVAGCGQTITPSADNDLVNIALLKTRTNLCAGCYAAWRATQK